MENNNLNNSVLEDICHENEDYYNYINQNTSDNHDNEDVKPYKNGLHFKYCALEYLVKNIPELEEHQCVNICPYIVNQTGKYPFLQFILKNNVLSFSSVLTFFSFNYKKNKHNVLEECEEKIQEFMMLYSNDKNLYKYNGYTIINDEVYMFFDFSNYNIQIQELYHCINSSVSRRYYKISYLYLSYRQKISMILDN